MRRLFAVALLSAVVAVPAFSQAPPAPPPNGQGGAGGGMGRFAPPPDHWMTIDSLGQALNLTADQRTKINPAYTALNGVMKDAAAKRQAFRQQMQGTFQPGQPPSDAQRAKFDSMRTVMDGFQAEAEQWLSAIRNNLTPEQQAKFDALQKPMLARRGPPGGGPTRP